MRLFLCWLYPVVMIHFDSQPPARASLAWSEGDASLASTALPSLLCVSSLLLFCFFNLLYSFLSHSQSNYWSSCINCQHLLTWPCPCEGNSARSWCSPWLNAQAPSFWMMERRYASLHLCFSLSGDQNFVLPFKFLSALLTLGCLSDCPHHKAFRLN